MNLTKDIKVTFTADQDSATSWNKRQIKLYSERLYINSGQTVTVLFTEYIATFSSDIAILGEFPGSPKVHK